MGHAERNAVTEESQPDACLRRTSAIFHNLVWCITQKLSEWVPQSVYLLPGPPTHYCQARDNSGITEHTTKGQPSRQGKSRTHIIKWSKNKNNCIFLYCNYKRHNIDIIYSYSRALLALQSLNAWRRRHGVILSALSPPSGDRDSFSFHWNGNLKLRTTLSQY